MSGVSVAAQTHFAPVKQSVVKNLKTVESSDFDLNLPIITQRSRDYNSFNRSFYLIATFWNFLGLFIILKSKLAPKVARLLDRRTTRPFVPVAASMFFFLLFMSVWQTPVGLISFWHERAYGFATQRIGTWISDRSIGFAFSLLAVPGAMLIYWLARRSPKRWWLWIWGVSVPWQIGFVLIWPIVVAPSYNEFKPIENKQLGERLRNLATKAGIPDAEVLQVDISRRTTRLNAYFTGIGPTKRIVIWDTTIATLTPDEIEAIMGHEIGHYVLLHTYWNLVFSIIGGFVILFGLSLLLPKVFARWGPRFGIKELTDPAGIPLAMAALSIILLLQTPIEAAISRHQEHAADQYGIDLVGNREAMAHAFIQFVKHDFSDPDPPGWLVWWSYSHPTLKDRIKFVLRRNGD
ncbi:MAG: M48 family metallopeptidase [Chthonomonadales bacterium]